MLSSKRLEKVSFRNFLFIAIIKHYLDSGHLEKESQVAEPHFQPARVGRVPARIQWVGT